MRENWKLSLRACSEWAMTCFYLKEGSTGPQAQWVNCLPHAYTSSQHQTPRILGPECHGHKAKKESFLLHPRDRSSKFDPHRLAGWGERTCRRMDRHDEPIMFSSTAYVQISLKSWSDSPTWAVFRDGVIQKLPSCGTARCLFRDWQEGHQDLFFFSWQSSAEWS